MLSEEAPSPGLRLLRPSAAATPGSPGRSREAIPTFRNEIVGEGSQVSAAEGSVSNIIFNAYKFSTKLVKVSLELLQDSAFDIEAFLKEQFAIWLGRGLNTVFTTGTGSGQPYGVLTQATAGPTAVGSSGNTGGSETGARLSVPMISLHSNTAWTHGTVLTQSTC